MERAGASTQKMLEIVWNHKGRRYISKLLHTSH